MAKAKGGLKTCEHCMSKMSLVAEVCPHCGQRAYGVFGAMAKARPEKQAAAQLGPPVTLEARREATRVCPDCAERVKAEARVCRFCGHQFRTPPRPEVF